MDGSSHWLGQAGNWNITASKGVIHEAVFSAPLHLDSTDWSWHKINYQDLKVDLSQHDVHLSQLKMYDGNMTLSATNPALSQSQSSAPEWRISTDKIQIEKMTLAIALPDGNLTLQSLKGQAAWPKQQALSFDLKSEQTNRATDAEWYLSGIVDKNMTNHLTDAEFSVISKHVPITALRPLLPLQNSARSPVTLAGTVNLNSHVSLHDGLWRMQGQANAVDVEVSHAGDIWTADHISWQFGPIGMGLNTQSIDHIVADNWAYVVALEPLHPTPRKLASTPALQTTWWAAALRSKNIHIRQLKLNQGVVSMGKKESRWAEEFDIQIDDLATKQWSNINATAKVGGGKLQLTGKWSALSKPQRFLGSASIQSALPFFSHSWMTASGMPRLIRGYLNASIDVEYALKEDRYQSRWQLQLVGGEAEAGNLNSDPMLARTGMNTYDLLRHLKQSNASIKLQGEVTGLWQQHPLSFEMIEQALLLSLSQAASRQDGLDKKRASQINKETEIATQIRLHEYGPLSMNERIRTYKIVRMLRNKPAIDIDLRPLWSGQELTSETLARIQYTQKLIKRYMVHHGISQERIFLRWPTDSDQVQEISSIQVELQLPHQDDKKVM